MVIAVVFDPPQPSDTPAVFNQKAFETLGDLNTWSTEANALQADVNAKQATATAAADTASTQAGIATTQAGIATSQATAALSSKNAAADSQAAAADSAASALASKNAAAASEAAAAASAASINDANLVHKTGDETIGGVKSFSSFPVLPGALGGFYKTDASSSAFTKTGAGTANIKAGTRVEVAGKVVQYATDTSITMPTLSAGTDYAIWVKDDATIQATTSFTSAPGAGNWRKIGGFHYAPGGNATGTSGGDATPAINAYSFWDLKFRPACQDPRGMTLVGDSFWADIYLLGVDHLANGTSRYNVTIADGSSPPKIPTKFGGNGTSAYGSLTWWEANEVLQSYGKRSPTYSEFAALAYGTTEATSGGTDPGSTILRQAYTSKWGVMLSTGNLWVWGDEFGGGAAAASWTANTGGRGSTYQMENAVIFGGNWGETSNSGSRCSLWNGSPSGSGNGLGARGVCDHLILD